MRTRRSGRRSSLTDKRQPATGNCPATDNRQPTTDNCSRRRSFLAWAAASAATVWLGGRSSAAPPRPAGGMHPIRLGGPIFNAPGDPEGLALAHKKAGYRAAYCPNVSLGDSQRIRDVKRAFAKYDVLLAEVGRWCNLMDVDPAAAGSQPEERHRGAGPGRRAGGPVLRGYRRLLQSDRLVRPAPRQPLAEVLRRGGPRTRATIIDARQARSGRSSPTRSWVGPCPTAPIRTWR